MTPRVSLLCLGYIIVDLPRGAFEYEVRSAIRSDAAAGSIRRMVLMVDPYVRLGKPDRDIPEFGADYPEPRSTSTT